MLYAEQGGYEGGDMEDEGTDEIAEEMGKAFMIISGYITVNSRYDT